MKDSDLSRHSTHSINEGDSGHTGCDAMTRLVVPRDGQRAMPFQTQGCHVGGGKGEWGACSLLSLSLLRGVLGGVALRRLG